MVLDPWERGTLVFRVEPREANESRSRSMRLPVARPIRECFFLSLLDLDMMMNNLPICPLSPPRFSLNFFFFLEPSLVTIAGVTVPQLAMTRGINKLAKLRGKNVD
jgi:hypothetical protein